MWIIPLMYTSYLLKKERYPFIKEGDSPYSLPYIKMGPHLFIIKIGLAAGPSREIVRTRPQLKPPPPEKGALSAAIILSPSYSGAGWGWGEILFRARYKKHWGRENGGGCRRRENCRKNWRARDRKNDPAAG
jgi:hypothetical protein